MEMGRGGEQKKWICFIWARLWTGCVHMIFITKKNLYTDTVKAANIFWKLDIILGLTAFFSHPSLLLSLILSPFPSWDRDSGGLGLVMLMSLGWLCTSGPPGSVSSVLQLQVCITMPGLFPCWESNSGLCACMLGEQPTTWAVSQLFSLPFSRWEKEGSEKLKSELVTPDWFLLVDLGEDKPCLEAIGVKSRMGHILSAFLVKALRGWAGYLPGSLCDYIQLWYEELVMSPSLFGSSGLNFASCYLGFFLLGFGCEWGGFPVSPPGKWKREPHSPCFWTQCSWDGAESRLYPATEPWIDTVITRLSSSHALL